MKINESHEKIKKIEMMNENLNVKLKVIKKEKSVLFEQNRDIKLCLIKIFSQILNFEDLEINRENEVNVI